MAVEFRRAVAYHGHEVQHSRFDDFGLQDEMCIILDDP